MIINIWWRHRSQLVFCLFVFNSVLHEVSQLTVFSSFISFFGWTCFPYLTALGIVDATCRPPPQACTSSPHPHRAWNITWHRPPENWPRILWAAGFPHRLLQGRQKQPSSEGPLAWRWGGSKRFWGIAKFNFQRVVHLLTPVSLPKEEMWPTFLLQKSLGNLRVVRAIHISSTEVMLNTPAKGHGANGWVVFSWKRTQILRNKGTRNVHRERHVSKGTMGPTPSSNKTHGIDASWG